VRRRELVLLQSWDTRKERLGGQTGEGIKGEVIEGLKKSLGIREFTCFIKEGGQPAEVQ